MPEYNSERLTAILSRLEDSTTTDEQGLSPTLKINQVVAQILALFHSGGILNARGNIVRDNLEGLEEFAEQLTKPGILINSQTWLQRDHGLILELANTRQLLYCLTQGLDQQVVRVTQADSHLYTLSPDSNIRRRNFFNLTTSTGPLFHLVANATGRREVRPVQPLLLVQAILDEMVVRNTLQAQARANH